MQAMRAGIRALRSTSSATATAWTRSHVPSIVESSPAIFTTTVNGVGGGVSNLGFVVGGARAFSQSATAASSCSSPYSSLELPDVSLRVMDIIQSFPFIDPSKVSPAASFKDDLQLDMLEKVQVMMAVEEEFAVDIPDNDANKISTTDQLIMYITKNPQAK